MAATDMAEINRKLADLSRTRDSVRALGDMPSLEAAFSDGEIAPAKLMTILTTMRLYFQEGMRATERMDQLLGDIIEICSSYCDSTECP